MGGFLSRNAVAPHEPLAVVAISQTPTIKMNKQYKLNALVPQPQGQRQPTHSADDMMTSTSKQPLTRAQIRVQFLKAAKQGDIVNMENLLQQYQQIRLKASDLDDEKEEEDDEEELVNIRGMWESTPLICAVQSAQCDAALWLLNHHADPHARNEKSVTALLLASLEGLLPVTVKLLESMESASEASAIDNQVGIVYNPAADMNIRLSPLLAASMNGHVEIVWLLLEHGAAVDQQVLLVDSLASPSSGLTALLLAARYGHVGVVTLLLQRNADYNLVDEATNSSALLTACEHGHEDCALLLFQAMTSRIQAQRFNDTETEKWQMANQQGYTPLHFAAANGLLDVCKAILSSLKVKQRQSLEDEVLTTAFINIRAGTRRESALLLAVRKRQDDVTRLLLEAGADPELTDRGGKTAMQVLVRNKQNALIQVYERVGKSQDELSSATSFAENELEALSTKPVKEAELRRAESHDGIIFTPCDV